MTAGIERILLERQALTPTGGDPVLDALETAILLEDCLAVQFTDAEILHPELADPAQLHQLLRSS